MKLFLILMAIMASRCNIYPEYARMDIVNIPGVAGSIEQRCVDQKQGTYIYSLTATDESAQITRYNLDIPTSAQSTYTLMPSTDVIIDGGILTWLHKTGETLTITVSGLGCRCGLPRLRPYFPLYIPAFYSENP